MTVESGQGGGPPRRKFDDVASLFGGIVPTALAVPPPVSAVPPPAAPRPAPAPPSKPPPRVEPAPVETRHPEPMLPGPIPEVKPAPKPARPRPTELRWPDAFEPRPNYRRREPRNWSWLLLIPVGFVAAVAVTSLDPHEIKTWVDANLLHRTPAATTSGPSPLLAPAPPQPQAPAPQVEAPSPYVAIPTSPLPVPPGADVSPPPPDPAQTAAPTAPVHITIQFRRNIPGADGEARRIATLLQKFGGSVELHPNNATTKLPTINYYNPADKAVATDLATALANEAVTWTVRAGAIKYPPGTLDIWLP